MIFQYFSVSTSKSCPAGCRRDGEQVVPCCLSVWRCLSVSPLHLLSGSAGTMLHWAPLSYTCKVGGGVQIMTNWRSLILNLPSPASLFKWAAGGREEVGVRPGPCVVRLLQLKPPGPLSSQRPRSSGNIKQSKSTQIVRAEIRPVVYILAILIL